MVLKPIQGAQKSSTFIQVPVIHKKRVFLKIKPTGSRDFLIKMNTTTELKQVTEVIKSCKSDVEYLFWVFQPFFWEPLDLWFFHFI